MPRFAGPRMGVRDGEIMTSFVAMRRLGLPDSIENFLSVPNGHCSAKLSVMIRTCFHPRRKTASQVLRHGAPGEEPGAPFGLDRLPRIDKFREKIKALAEDVSQVKGRRNEMSRRCLAAFGDDLGRAIDPDKRSRSARPAWPAFPEPSSTARSVACPRSRDCGRTSSVAFRRSE